MKPDSMFDLPSALLKSFLEKLDLDYDVYESSQVETIDDILHRPVDSISSTNKYIINNYWKGVSEIAFQTEVKIVLDELKRSIELIQDCSK
jgi:hypothetical protein